MLFCSYFIKAIRFNKNVAHIVRVRKFLFFFTIIKISVNLFYIFIFVRKRTFFRLKNGFRTNEKECCNIPFMSLDIRFSTVLLL